MGKDKQEFIPYLKQDYARMYPKLLKAKKLFEDHAFPAGKAAFGKHGNGKVPDNCEWKRPTEFCDEPKFIVDNITANDVDQGVLNDCWFLSAAAAVCTVPEYIKKVIPDGQSFDKDTYAGIFRFRFWYCGHWIEVVIDDFLPTKDGELIFAHNKTDKNEMFAPLLEKAYAKLHSSYAFLNGGMAIDALTDMTGGVFEQFELKKKEKGDLWMAMQRSFELKSLMGAQTIDKDGKDGERENGIVSLHAYTVLSCVELVKNGDKHEVAKEPTDDSIKLVRLRNPWGRDVSYKGAWCAGSTEWEEIDDGLKEELKANAAGQSDGEFFMSFEDFVETFEDLDIMHIDMNAFSSTSDSHHSWLYKDYKGKWIPKQNAGGCGNEDFQDYWTNPQYQIELTLENKVDDKVSVMIALMQTDKVRKRAKGKGKKHDNKSANEPIGFGVFRVKDDCEEKFGSKKLFQEKEVTDVFRTSPFMAQTTITSALNLDPGKYVIIPSTFHKNVAGRFLLRFFVEGGGGKKKIKSKGVSTCRGKKYRKKPNETKKQREASIIEEEGEKKQDKLREDLTADMDMDIDFEKDFDFQVPAFNFFDNSDTEDDEKKEEKQGFFDDLTKDTEKNFFFDDEDWMDFDLDNVSLLSDSDDDDEDSKDENKKEKKGDATSIFDKAFYKDIKVFDDFDIDPFKDSKTKSSACSVQ